MLEYFTLLRVKLELAHLERVFRGTSPSIRVLMKVMTLFINEISRRSSVTVVRNNERILMQNAKYIRVIYDVIMRDHRAFPPVVKLNDSLFDFLLESAESSFAILSCH